MDGQGMGRVLITLGILMIVVGVLFRFGALSWFGNLPGDIRITNERTRIFVPITSMLLVSVVVSLLVSLFRR
jgi:hypothetical protein